MSASPSEYYASSRSSASSSPTLSWDDSKSRPDYFDEIMPLPDAPRGRSESPSSFASTVSSRTKNFERSVVRAWKSITRVTRKNPRESFLPHDFILVTSATSAAMKRKSIMRAPPRA